ncbi:CDP-diacylglycerol--serine O-phosphatidyltransferase [Desertibacillus haloalkaliphilus]|uniref:CDP-diacylglycerol--serine O-phosphatidyltransferase n=1 Tax=Desertibacillus haloalkaliphilus TaxID=1328930 RepID=UPI001C2758AF|nr:CDP-diacylglycerol--serine O-phosphatidyltransferase [Desertibacillus haloalkaliphilus]MBU8905594.1 CDP-diacylglycerol--serine O-phosphatidyltransferase [Desertibacillus haloalkaliphilus]
MFLLQHLDHTIKKIKSQTANLLTIINLSLGSFALVFIIQGELRTSLLLITLAAFFDRLDGMVARKLNITSDLGKQLDSLCDIISFGVAPSLLLYQAVLSEFGFAGAFFTIIFIACGAIRLARFNVSESPGFFIGLPITAAGCLLTVSFLFVSLLPSYVFMFFILILSLLMISTLKVRKV